MTTPGNFDADVWPPDVPREDAPNGFKRRRATCETEGCPGAGIASSVYVYNNADGIHRCVCGFCGKPNRLEPEDGKS